MSDKFLDDILDGPRTPNTSDELEPDDIDDRHYRAYKTGHRTVECELRTVKPFEHGLPYAYTYTTIAFSQVYSFFWVVTSFFVLKVKGRNLRPIVRALRAHKVAYLQEFNEKKHDIPDNKNDPVITQLDVIIQPASASYQEAAEKFGPQAAPAIPAR